MLLAIGLLCAFLAMICWGFGDFLIQHSVRKVGDFETLAFIGIIGAIILLPFVWSDLPMLFLPQNFAIILILCVITTLAAAFNFEALKKGKLSVTEVLIELELPITIILALLFLGEAPTLFQLGIIAMIFVGLVLIATRSFKHFKHAFEKGALLALIAAFFMGGVNFFVGVSARELSPLLTIWASWIIVAAFCIPIIWRREGLKKMFRNAGRFKKLVLATGIFDTLAWLFFAFAVVDAPIGITTAITESYVVLALILGVILNKEKIRPHQYLGALLAITCSAILAVTATAL